MFGRFFKPRWQHNDAAVRERAINEMAADNEAERTILTTLLKGDSSPSVRAAAASRMNDMNLLDQIIQRDSDSGVRLAAAQQIEKLLAGTADHSPSLENRLRMVALTDNIQVLGAVARDGKEVNIRLAAISRLNCPQTLTTLAIEGRDPESRIAAAEKIHSDIELRRLSREGRDKKVLRLARDRLKTLQQKEQQHEQAQTRATELLDHLRAHATRAVDGLYIARFQQLASSWQEVLDSTSAEQQQLGSELLQRCQAVIDELHAAEAQAKAEQSAQQEQSAAVSTLQETLTALEQEEVWQAASSLQALLNSQQRRWQAASEVIAASTELQKRYSALEDRWQRLIAGLAQLGEETAVAINWPSDLPKPPALRQADTTVAEPQGDDEPTAAPDDKKPTQAFDRLLGTLQSALRQRQLKFANRLWHRVESEAEHATGGQRARMEKLKSQLDELRDWHAFAADPKKQQLCEDMEKLSHTDMEPQEKADAIQILHDQWRALMSADQQSDQALWDRFREASDLAWAPCRAHFAELDKVRQHNLEKRIGLCDQLEQYLNNLDTEGDHNWGAVAEIRRTAPQEWKSYQPVRFTDARDASKRFSELLKKLDELLDSVANQHREALEALIARAETLASSEDARAATEECKGLQKQWQATGWVPANIQRKLYKRFRGLADDIFARRHQEQQAHQQELAAQSTALRDQLNALNQALQQPMTEESIRALGTLIDDTLALPCPRREENLHKQREALINTARARRKAWPQWQRWHNIRERIEAATTTDETPSQRQLAVALEVSADQPSPDDAREERMQWQLQQLSGAMKSNSPNRYDSCLALLEASDIFNDGINDSVRQRLLTVWDALEPKE